MPPHRVKDPWVTELSQGPAGAAEGFPGAWNRAPGIGAARVGAVPRPRTRPRLPGRTAVRGWGGGAVG